MHFPPHRDHKSWPSRNWERGTKSASSWLLIYPHRWGRANPQPDRREFGSSSCPPLFDCRRGDLIDQLGWTRFRFYRYSTRSGNSLCSKRRSLIADSCPLWRGPKLSLSPFPPTPKDPPKQSKTYGINDPQRDPVSGGDGAHKDRNQSHQQGIGHLRPDMLQMIARGGQRAHDGGIGDG